MLRSLAGDQEAHERLLMKVAQMLRGYLTKSISPTHPGHESVEDLVQDVLLAIHQKRHTYRTDLPILPWVFSIARYRLIDSVRAAKRVPLSVPWDDEFSPPVEDQHEGLEKMEVERALEGLSPKQREALMLAKVEGLPLADVASKMKMSLSAVKVTIHRAMKALKKGRAGRQHGKAEDP
ncbi:MAG TPA: sigma-70 family RNA polymerase sigma factor [Bdellovibrionota bacterium]|nr:sigma-70 family RNA polymerase sigma factor [Bdellovibrionota bacterium]